MGHKVEVVLFTASKASEVYQGRSRLVGIAVMLWYSMKKGNTVQMITRDV